MFSLLILHAPGSSCGIYDARTGKPGSLILVAFVQMLLLQVHGKHLVTVKLLAKKNGTRLAISQTALGGRYLYVSWHENRLSVRARF